MTEVVAVTYHESGSRSVEVECWTCGDVHTVQWLVGTREVATKCGVVEIPDWAQGHRTGFGKRETRGEHLLRVAESETSDDRSRT
jgi:hypothetical protein